MHQSTTQHLLTRSTFRRSWSFLGALLSNNTARAIYVVPVAGYALLLLPSIDLFLRVLGTSISYLEAGVGPTS